MSLLSLGQTVLDSMLYEDDCNECWGEDCRYCYHYLHLLDLIDELETKAREG